MLARKIYYNVSYFRLFPIFATFWMNRLLAGGTYLHAFVCCIILPFTTTTSTSWICSCLSPRSAYFYEFPPTSNGKYSKTHSYTVLYTFFPFIHSLNIYALPRRAFYFIFSCLFRLFVMVGSEIIYIFFPSLRIYALLWLHRITATATLCTMKKWCKQWRQHHSERESNDDDCTWPTRYRHLNKLHTNGIIFQL